MLGREEANHIVLRKIKRIHYTLGHYTNIALDFFYAIN